MDPPPTLSHVISSPKQCTNIKSIRKPKARCTNPATHGDFCGIHYKKPRVWAIKQTLGAHHTDAVKHIQQWWRLVRGLYLFSTRGPAFYNRASPVNDTDFFSTDKIIDISGAYFFSYKDNDNHVYAFDIRSIHSLLENAHKSNSVAENPYTRAVLSDSVKEKVNRIVKLLRAQGCTTTWEPLTPSTPEQQFRMKVVDVFHTIDELNYYSSPDWFINMNVRAHRRFYTELHDIWIHRAGLSLLQKNLIIPGFPHKIFRHAPWALRESPLDAIQKINLNTIRTFIKSAEDRNDRILGAMYVVTALTIVCPAARDAYPWLFESVDNGNAIVEPYVLLTADQLAWINQILGDVGGPPPLVLPPPAAE